MNDSKILPGQVVFFFKHFSIVASPLMIAWSQSMQPSAAIVFLGPVQPLHDSWQLRHIPSFEYLENGHSGTQNLPSLTFAHSSQSSAFGPLHDPLHCGWQSPHVFLSIW